MAEDYEKSEQAGRIARTLEDARRLHHLASADPEPERDGLMTGPAHEERYGLDRAEESAARWRAIGVHPTENRALVGDEDGAENLRGVSGELETADGNQNQERAVSPKAAKK